MDGQITDFDLMAYVDGQLDARRVIEVEAYLAAHPEVAARVMQDLRQRDEIREALANFDAPLPAETVQLTERLVTAMGRWPRLRWFGRAALVAMLLSGGWFGHDLYREMRPIGRAVAFPILVDEAAEAHRMMLLSAVSGQAGAEPADLALLLSGSARGSISLPDPSARSGLKRIGTAFVVFEEGDALQVLYQTPDGHRVTLFATVLNQERDVLFQSVHDDNLPVVYWQRGSMAYALIGDIPADVLLETAIHLENF
jgi:anti-sigma factor RsiW